MSDKLTRFISRASGAALLLVLGASLVSAQTCSSSFTSILDFGNTALAAGASGPYGTVVVCLTSTTTASIVFTSDSGFLFGDGGSVDANGLFSYTSATGNSPGGNIVYSNGGTGNVDGIGSFAAEVDSFDGFTDASSTITLNVTATGSTTWTNANQVLTTNTNGYDAGAHIFVCVDPTCADRSLAASVTGFAGETGAGVPEPASVSLLGGVLLALAIAIKRRFV